MANIIILDSFEKWNTTDPLLKWDTISDYNAITVGAQYGRNGSGARVESGGTSVFDTPGVSSAGGNSSAMFEKYFVGSTAIDVGFAIKLSDVEPIDYMPIASFINRSMLDSFVGSYYHALTSLLLTPQQQLVFCTGNFFDSPIGIIGGYSPPIKRNVFSYIEIFCKIHTNGHLRIRLDGKVVVDQQANTIANAGVSFVNGIRFFHHKSRIGGGANARVFQFDDVYVAVDGPTEFREGLIEGAVPNGTGEQKQWDSSVGGPDNYVNVDESQSDEDSTFNSSSTQGDIDTYDFPTSVSSGTVHALTMSLAATNKVFDKATMAAVFRKTGTNYTSSALQVGTAMPNNPLGYIYHTYGYEVSPATGVQFNASEISSGEWGMKLVTGSAGGGGGGGGGTTPNAPTNLVATTISGSRIDLTFTDNSDNEIGFKVEVSADAGGLWSETAQIGGSPYSVTELPPGQTFHFRIRAFNAAGNSAYTNIAFATTTSGPTPPGAPDSMAAQPLSSTQILAGWHNNVTSTQDGTKVERSDDGVNDFEQIGVVLGDVAQFVDTELAPRTKYYYRARHYNGGGNGPYSDVANATTLAATPPPTADFYVSTLGSDGNVGTDVNHPFRTIGKGISVLTAGKRLEIRGGTYQERISNLSQTFNSGTSYVNAVTIAAYASETVIVKPATGTPALHLQYNGTVLRFIIFDGITFDGYAANGTTRLANFTVNFDGVNENFATQNIHHIRLVNCEVRGGSGSGVLTGRGANFLEFIGGKYHHNGVTAGQDHGIYLESSDCLVEKGEFYNNVGFGIHIYNGWAGQTNNRNVVRGNRVHDNRSGIIVGSGNSNVVYNNLVYSNTADYALGVGFFNPDGTLVYNNTVYSNVGDGIQIRSGSTNTTVRNNISYLNSVNINNLAGGQTTLSNNPTTNPSFVNPAAGDFHLSVGSAAINAGVTITAVPNDYDGNLRPQGSAYDVGAYERPS